MRTTLSAQRGRWCRHKPRSVAAEARVAELGLELVFGVVRRAGNGVEGDAWKSPVQPTQGCASSGPPSATQVVPT